MNKIVGFVDGFMGHELCGWLANLDSPGALEPFMLRDHEGRTVTFSTQCLREDVCAALGRDGLFGFAVRHEWIAELRGTLSVLDRDGSIVEGGEAITPPADRFVARGAAGTLSVILHLPKTGGTSLRHAIMAGLPPSETLLLYPMQANGHGVDFSGMPLHQRRRLRYIMGHIGFGIHEKLGVPARYSIFIRDPLTRLQSNFIDHLRRGDLFVRDGQTARLVDIISDGQAEEFDNLIVRTITGLTLAELPLGSVSSTHVDAAVEIVREHFEFVGLTETMEESFSSFRDVLCLPHCQLGWDNLTPPGDLDRNLGSVRWWDVMHRNRHDVALYDALRRSRLIGRIG